VGSGLLSAAELEAEADVLLLIDDFDGLLLLLLLLLLFPLVELLLFDADAGIRIPRAAPIILFAARESMSGLKDRKNSIPTIMTRRFIW
jgi:hypothetical protein